MSESVVERGERLLAAQRAAADQAAAAEREEEVRELGFNAIASLLEAVTVRLAAVEAELCALRDHVVGTRIRRPVRDETGTILYVVDEPQPPAEMLGPVIERESD